MTYWLFDIKYGYKMDLILFCL